MTLDICLAGATGWAGAAVARGIASQPDMRLVAAVSRSHAGQLLGEVLGVNGLTTRIFASADAALATPCKVFVEYTSPSTAKAHVLTALAHGAHVVVGTSGLTDDDYDEIDTAARHAQRGVLACGNFALSAVLLLKCAEMVAKHLRQWEIVEYASASKRDVPSGTVRELATRLGSRPPAATVPPEHAIGEVAARGANVHGTQVHALRLPGFSMGVDVVFGAEDETLVLRQNAGSSAKPYVNGALLAIHRVSGLIGVHRGLDRLLEAASNPSQATWAPNSFGMGLNH